MKKVLSLRIAALLVVLLTFVGVPLHQSVSATVSAAAPQSQFFPPVDFYRFIVNNTELGTLLTTNFQEGVNLNFANYPFPQTAKIAVPPAPGWTPTPGQGLIPLYRYHISQNGRIYYGFFNGPASGNGYTFQGIAGYVFPGNGAFGGIPLQAYYSQTRGYFYTVGNEVPIGYPYYNGFVYHGAPCYLPQGGQFSWDPPPQCDPDGSMQQQCNNNGGTWNQNTCSCNFIGPDPCRGGARSSARPIEPCIQLIKVPPVKDNPEK
jgi:hypothetical protein